MHFYRLGALFLLISIVTASFADDYPLSDFELSHGKLSREQIERRLNLVLVKSPELFDQMRLTDTSWSLYATAGEKQEAKAPIFELQLRPAGPSVASNRVVGGLKGKKIAIDPGHLGGKYARVEERYIDMKANPAISSSEQIQFDEGTLTVLTARKLRSFLEDEGAEVFLTRTEPGESVYPIPFDKWKGSPEYDKAIDDKVSLISDPQKKAEAKAFFTTAKDNVLFRSLYNNLDIKERARLINEFKTAATVAIHYNAAGGNDPVSGQNLGTSRNYHMVFVPGAFAKGELGTEEARYHFIRLLVGSEVDDSILLSSAIATHFQSLQVPLAAASEESAPYLQKFCLPTHAEGVFCRNLALIRLIRGPIGYGESLCQDNYQECLLLNERTEDIDGFKTSPRVTAVAKAYFEALKKFFP